MRYLNGQITNQVDQLPEGESRYAVITNHKGQLEGDLYVYQSGPFDGDESAGLGLIVDAPAELRESLHTRLDRYIIADDVELTDITESWSGFHLLLGDAEPPALPSGLAGELKGTETPFQQTRSRRFGPPGLDLWMPSGSELAQEALAAHGLEELGHEALERTRIRHGVPLWGRELIPGMLPPEARIEDRAIDYEKGCYIGQEVISRIKSVGKVNRQLVLLSVQVGDETDLRLPEPEAALDLHLPPSGGTSAPVGKITSVTNAGNSPMIVGDQASSSPSEVLALGYVKSQHAAPGTDLVAVTVSASAPASDSSPQESDSIPCNILPFPTSSSSSI